MPYLRVKFARFLMRFGHCAQSLAVTVMKPADLIAFSRQTYSRPGNILSVGEEQYNRSGLTDSELAMIRHLPARQGKLLLLGVGGGREAIPLAQMGFEVTGVDYVSELVSRACENAGRAGVNISGLVQEISRLDVPAGSVDVIWLSVALYSSIPTRKLRLAMLHRFVSALKPGGYALIRFHWDHHPQVSNLTETLKKVFAFLVAGNVDYETGDTLHYQVEFIHNYSSAPDLRRELDQCGLQLVELNIPKPDEVHGWAVLKKVRG
jgi:SAM-dependent methyltransferase